MPPFDALNALQIPGPLGGEGDPNVLNAPAGGALLTTGAAAIAKQRADDIAAGLMDAEGHLTPAGYEAQRQVLLMGFGPADIGAIGLAGIIRRVPPSRGRFGPLPEVPEYPRYAQPNALQPGEAAPAGAPPNALQPHPQAPPDPASLLRPDSWEHPPGLPMPGEPEFIPTPGVAGTPPRVPGAAEPKAPIAVATTEIPPPIGHNMPPDPMIPGEANTVSTRVPTAANTPIDPHGTNGLLSGIDAMRASTQAFGRNMEKLKNADLFPDMKVDHLTDPHAISEAAINHMRDNLVHIHDEMVRQFGQPMVDRAAEWYGGAHSISNDMSKNFGYTPAQTAAMLANLSPQKNWYENADLGRRLLETMRDQMNTKFTAQMGAWGQRYLAEQAKDLAKKTRDANTPGKVRNLEVKRLDIENTRTLLDRLQRSDMTLGQLDAAAKAGDAGAAELRSLFVRAFDEGHNPRSFPVVNPEGTFGDIVKTDKGKPRNISWGSFPEVEKALAALDSPDLAHISRTLGDRHKVRNFHNNIASPDSPRGHVTADTHQIAGAHMMPYGASSATVDLGLGGGSSSNATGAMGTYGLYHEATRRAAEVVNARRGVGHNSGNLLPRQMQSITWEGARAMFPDTIKRDTAFVAQARAIWQGFRDGLYSADEARRLMMQHAAPNGLPAPPWHNPTPRGPETR